MTICLRQELKIIADMIEPNSRVLDIGCADGKLLEFLAKEKNVDARGLEISIKNVQKALKKGLSVAQGDADKDLSFYPDNAFDYVILSDTLQAMNEPKKTLEEMLKIGKYAIVSIPNFAHWSCRLHLMFKGTMPVTKSLPFSWYDTPNIHFCTISDFFQLCQKMSLKIKKSIAIDSKYNIKQYKASGFFANLFAQNAIYLITKEEKF